MLFQSLETGLLYKFGLHDVIKRYLTLLSHFVGVKDLFILTELFCEDKLSSSVQLMLEYLRIFFPIFFALNELKKVK